MAVVFNDAPAAGNPLPRVDYQENVDAMENGLLDLGQVIISGLAISVGAGLSVNVATGVASIGGRVTVSVGFAISVADNLTNHLYLLNTGAGTSNTTGTQPAGSVKLGTCVAAAGVVSSVAQTWASGRQLLVRHENLVHGSGAGHPRAVDLASWHATNNEGNEIKGTLPGGAMPPVDHGSLTGLADDDHTQYAFLSPASSARNVILPTGAFTALTLKAPASGTANQLESQDNAGSAAARFRVLSTGVPSCPGTGTDSERYGEGTTAGGNFSFAFGKVVGANADNSIAIGRNCNANGAGSICIGQAAGTGSSAANSLAIGAVAVCNSADSLALGFGAVVGVGQIGCILFGRQTSPTAANQLVIGSPIAGSHIAEAYLGGGVTNTAPVAVVLSATGGSGTNIAGANLTLAAGKGTGNAAAGDLIFSIADAGGSGTTLQTLREKWRIVNNSGELRSSLLSSVQVREVFSILPSYVVNTDASRTTRAVLAMTDFGGERECFRLESSGTAAMIGFLGAAAVVRPAATTDLRQALIDLGLYTTGGATPLDLNGGNLTVNAATINADSTLADGVDLALGTTNGTKIGTSTTQKIGFHNAAPTVQDTGWAPTNVTTDRVFDANATTLDEIADCLGTLIQQLTTKGIIGA